MRKKISCFVVYASALLLAVGAMLSSCNSAEKRQDSETTVEQTDSLINNCADTTALKVLILQLKDEGDVRGQYMAYQRLGVMQREASRFMDAIETHRRGYELAQLATDTLSIVQHLNNIGTNFRRMGILDEAATYHYRALTYCEENSDTSFTARKNRVVSLNGIGNVQLTLGNMEAADSAFRAALHGEHELGSALGQAINYANLGAIFEDRGLIDSARMHIL